MDPSAKAGKGAVDFDTAFRSSITPQTEDFDELGHVNNAVYLRWAQDMAVRHWTTIAPEALVASRIWVVLRHEVDYRDPVEPGDTVEGRTWLGRASGPRYERFVDLRKPGAKRPAALVRSDWCMLDMATRKPLRVGSDILDAFGVAPISAD